MILLIASLAFVLDAALDEPLRRHYFAAAACLPILAWILMGAPILLADDLALRDWSMFGAFALGIAFVVKDLRLGRGNRQADRARKMIQAERVGDRGR